MRSQLLLVLSILSLHRRALAAPLTPKDVLKVLRRDSSNCPRDSQTRCDDPDLPDNYCCDNGSSCLSLGNFEDTPVAICCDQADPEECNKIKPFSCDALKAAVHDPQILPVLMFNWPKEFDDCAPPDGDPDDKCCPPGYECAGNRKNDVHCKRVDLLRTTSSKISESTRIIPRSTVFSSTSTAISLSTPHMSTESPLPTASPNLNHTDSTSIPSSQKFSAGAILTGFFPGLLAGVILALMAICCHKRRQTRHSMTPSPGPKFSHFREKSIDKGLVSISDPIPSAAQDSVRTDFLRHNRGDDGALSKIRRTSARVKGFFIPRPTAEDIAIIPTNTNNYETPQRQPSTESIKVFSPEHLGDIHPGLNPSLKNGRPQTTFTEMMERVGFQNKRGSPFFSVTPATPPQLRSPIGRP
ncbi:hypothetical protein FQN53_007602 [Emmonsiellopsis sp. PD_33]|nr:hypothetical protein FQN53_007602 [Emmonsiellopsis sp. PD_33]